MFSQTLDTTRQIPCYDLAGRYLVITSSYTRAFLSVRYCLRARFDNRLGNQFFWVTRQLGDVVVSSHLVLV